MGVAERDDDQNWSQWYMFFRGVFVMLCYSCAIVVTVIGWPGLGVALVTGGLLTSVSTLVSMFLAGRR